jgi:hypothetical protein
MRSSARCSAGARGSGLKQSSASTRCSRSCLLTTSVVRRAVTGPSTTPNPSSDARSNSRSTTRASKEFRAANNIPMSRVWFCLSSRADAFGRKSSSGGCEHEFTRRLAGAWCVSKEGHKLTRDSHTFGDVTHRRQVVGRPGCRSAAGEGGVHRRCRRPWRPLFPPVSTPSRAHRAMKSYSWNEVTCGTQRVSTKPRWTGCVLYAS